MSSAGTDRADLASFGLAHADAGGLISDLDLFSAGWLPAKGKSLFDCAVFVGTETDFEAMREGRQPVLAIGGAKLDSWIDRIDIRVCWRAQLGTFEILSIVSSVQQSYSAAALQSARSARILEERIAEQQRIIAESSRLFTALVKRIPAAVAMLDNDLRYLHATEGWTEAIGRSEPGTYLKDSNSRLGGRLQSALAAGDLAQNSDIVASVRGPDSVVRWYSFGMCRWLDETGAPGGSIIVATDRTRDVAKQKAMQAANSDLRHLSLAISHDLRAPVRQIQALSQFLSEDYSDSLPSDGRELTDHMRACSLRLESMLDGLLRMMSIPAMRRRMDLVPLNDCISVAVSQLKGDVDRLGFRIDIGDLPTVRGDRLLLEMFFQNLLQNSLKYANGPAPVFRVFATDDAGQLRIIVSDNGPGIPRAKRGRAFQLFEQLEQRGQPGIGAGLALCKRIAEVHGASLSIVDGLDSGLSLALALVTPKGAMAPKRKKRPLSIGSQNTPLSYGMDDQ